jgi:hypothetical protein
VIPFLSSFAVGPAQTRPQNCVQTSIALALGIPVEAVEREAGSTATLRLPDVRWLTDRLGVASPLMAAELVAQYWPLYYRRYGGRRLRGYGIRTPRAGEPIGHAFALFGPRLYDPLTGKGIRLSPRLLREHLDWVGFVDPSADSARRLEQLRQRYRDAGL